MKNGKFPWYLLAAAGGYLILRHTGKTRGATYEEVHTSLPGDEVIPHPMEETTHAISIDAPPEIVWKWIIQGGYRGSGRAGWYSDSWLDKVNEGIILRLSMPSNLTPEKPSPRSADEILPEYQHTTVGDIIPDGPPNSAYFVVREVQEERAWVLYSDTHMKYLTPTLLHGTALELNGEFTWVFVLNPTEQDGTRLILRTRARYGPRWFSSLFLPILYLGESLIPNLILNGITERAERMTAA